MPKANRKNITKTKSKAHPREGLDLIDASYQRKSAPEPDLKRELRMYRHPADVGSLVVIYDAYMAAADAIMGIENQPRAEGTGDLLEAECSWLILKAWTVAEQIKSMTPMPSDRAAFARTLFDCALDMDNDLDVANSVLQAAMAVGVAE